MNGILSGGADVNDSPEIGPPPIAHFDEGDPVNFYPERKYIASKTSPKLEDKMRSDNMTDLGARKKRRETSNLGQPLLDESMVVESIQPRKPLSSSSSNSQPFKPGAKRKLNLSEGDDNGGSTRTSDTDDFLFDRRPVSSARTSPTKKNIIKTGTSVSHATSQDLSKGVSSSKSKDATNTTLSRGRKVLGPSGSTLKYFFLI